MGHMAVGLMVVTYQIEMTQFKMTYCWTLWIGEGIDTGMILVLIQVSTMIVISIILRGGVIGDICEMSLRKKGHQHLMEI